MKHASKRSSKFNWCIKFPVQLKQTIRLLRSWDPHPLSLFRNVIGQWLPRDCARIWRCTKPLYACITQPYASPIIVADNILDRQETKSWSSWWLTRWMHQKPYKRPCLPPAPWSQNDSTPPTPFLPQSVPTDVHTVAVHVFSIRFMVALSFIKAKEPLNPFLPIPSISLPHYKRNRSSQTPTEQH